MSGERKRDAGRWPKGPAPLLASTDFQSLLDELRGVTPNQRNALMASHGQTFVYAQKSADHNGTIKA